MRYWLAAPAAVLAIVGCTGGSADSREPSRSASSQSVAQSVAQHAAATTPTDWTTYHGNRARTGVSTTMPAFTGSLSAHKVTLDGAVYGSPLAVRGRIFVATENDTVYALTTGGSVIWKKHLGTPAPQSQLPCGNIFPLGITGTMVYFGGYLYVAAEFGSPVRHALYSLHFSDGSTQWRRTLDYPGVDASAMQQRAALTVANSRVWVAFGGLAGDCAAYKGRVIGHRLDGTGNPAMYTVPTTREAGIWATPGPAVDSSGSLYVAVGNGAATSDDPYDKSDSVLKLDANAHLVSYFAPSSWASDNASDLDLGSQGPALVGTQSIFAAGKSGKAYILSRSALGGIGGQRSSADLCRSFGGTAVIGATVYVPCTDGLRSVHVNANSTMTVNWHGSIPCSPVIGGGRIWCIDTSNGVLHALSESTGSSTNNVAVGSANRFATPALYGHLVLVPTLAGVTIVTES